MEHPIWMKVYSELYRDIERETIHRERNYMDTDIVTKHRKRMYVSTYSMYMQTVMLAI